MQKIDYEKNDIFSLSPIRVYSIPDTCKDQCCQVDGNHMCAFDINKVERLIYYCNKCKNYFIKRSNISRIDDIKSKGTKKFIYMGGFEEIHVVETKGTLVPEIKKVDYGKLHRKGSDSSIYYIWMYEPYHRGSNPKFNNISDMILRFKERNQDTYNNIVSTLLSILGKDIVLCSVPSSKTENVETGLTDIIHIISGEGRDDGADVLVRMHDIPKLSCGGCRDVSIHLNSISCSKPAKIGGKTVVLLDDVTTSGNSLIACKKILLRSGAKSVITLALSCTSGYELI